MCAQGSDEEWEVYCFGHAFVVGVFSACPDNSDETKASRGIEKKDSRQKAMLEPCQAEATAKEL